MKCFNFLAKYHFFYCRGNLRISFVELIHKFKFWDLHPLVHFMIFGLVQRHCILQHSSESSLSVHIRNESTNKKAGPQNWLPGLTFIPWQPSHLVSRPVAFRHSFTAVLALSWIYLYIQSTKNQCIRQLPMVKFTLKPHPSNRFTQQPAVATWYALLYFSVVNANALPILRIAKRSWAWSAAECGAFLFTSRIGDPGVIPAWQPVNTYAIKFVGAGNRLTVRYRKGWNNSTTWDFPEPLLFNSDLGKLQTKPFHEPLGKTFFLSH